MLHRGLLCGLLASTALVTPAFAQSALSETIALPRQELDQNGVDPANGHVVLYQSLLSIGPSGPGGLRYVIANGNATNASNYTLALTGDPSTSISLSVGFRGINFTNIGGVLTPDDGSGVTLTVNGTQYTLTLEDGTVIVFTGFGIYDNYKARGTSITYPTGEKVTLAYDTIEWCTTTQDTCTTFGHALRLATISNSAGYQLQYNYARDDILTPLQADSWKRLVSVKAINTTVDPASQSWPTVTFDASGSGITDATGNHWAYSVSSTQFTMQRPSASAPNFVANLDANLRVSSIVTDGQTWTYSFTPGSGTMTEVRTDPLGHSRTVVADTAVGLPTSITDENGHVTTRHYTNNRLDKLTFPEGNYVTYAYDSRGNLTSETRVAKPGSGLANIVTSATYPSTCTDASCNEPTTTTDARGNVTNYAYNADGSVQSVTSPAPTTGAVRPTTTYTYASVTLPDASSVSKLSTVSTCQTLASCAGAADQVKTTYNWSNQEIPTGIVKGDGTGALAATTTFGHDNIGNITAVDGPLAGTADTTIVRYDLARRRVGMTSPDPDGGAALKMRAIRYSYSVDGNLAKVERGTVNSASDADWAAMSVLETTTIGFDAAARPSIYSLAGYDGVIQAVRQLSYDSDGRPLCSAVRMNSAVFGSLPGDACTLGAQGGDGPDRVSKLVYDNAGQATQLQVGVGTAAAANERTVTYTNNGKVATLTDANNNLTAYQYDGFDRLSKTLYPSTTVGLGTSNVNDFEQLTYDAAGNVTSRRLRDGNSIGFTFDNLDRPTLKNLPGTEPDVTYAYDNLGRLTSASESGNNLSFTYDALSRNLTQTGPQGTVTSTYDLAGNRTQITYPGSGLFVNYDYFLTGDVQKIRENGAVSGIGVLATYGYDDLGNRVSVIFGNGVTEQFVFDPVSRLGGIIHDLPGTANDLTINIFDNAASQITSAPRSNDVYAWTGTVSVNRAYTANGLNQYTTAGAATFAYDAKGNLTSDGTNSYCYSSENLLTGMNGACSAPTVGLTYDPLLRLYQVAASSTTRFAYDGLNLIADSDASNVIQHRYVFGPGIDEPLVEYAGSGTSSRTFLSVDERGSVIARTDNAGALSTANSYDEYGIPGSGNGGLFQYTGQAWISQLGMYYYKARIYSPTLGRFMQTDPIGYEDGANWYAYVHDDPANNIDPLGLSCTVVLGSVNICGHRQQDAPPLTPAYGNRDNSLRSPGERNGRDGRTDGQQPDSSKPTVCTGHGRGLSGNLGLVGKQGGIPGQTVAAGSAAVIPQQFGFPSGVGLAPFASRIHGTIGKTTFQGVTDVIGGVSPLPGVPVRTALQELFPNQLILEIPGARDQGQNAPVTIILPSGVQCPTGTAPAGG